MSLKLQLPKLIDVKPRLTVAGVGGAGCNAVNNMIAAGLQGVEFIVANTDAQSLAASSAEHRIQLGAQLTEGLGAGSKPEIGEAAAEEAIQEIRAAVAGSHMVFVAAGMGGGTGTGAAAVIARAAKELGILTVGIVTKPFQFEGARRARIAEAGVHTLRQHVDTLIVIPNQNLFRIANERTTFAEAFVLADQVLYSGIACIVDLVLKEGLINLDFADVKTTMTGMGTAMMGTGEASGEGRAILAAEEAIANPLLDDISLRGARGLLLSITGGRDLTLYEVDEAASRVRQEVDPECNIIVGATFDENLGERVRVSIVASGMKRADEPAQPVPQTNAHPVLPAKSNDGARAPLVVPLQPASFVQAPPQFAANAPQSAPAQNPHEEVHRRLAEALQTHPPAFAPPQQHAPAGWPHQHAAQQEPRERRGWNAPGNVVIEEGYTPLSQQGVRNSAASAMPVAPVYVSASQQPQRGFEPQPPVEIRRELRRMPMVEEFPPVGQREWHAKQGAMNNANAVDDGRRKGLLGRLTSLGRRSVEAPAPGHQGAGARSDDDIPLPVFFGRERR